jgi:hypothetical protein
VLTVIQENDQGTTGTSDPAEYFFGNSDAYEIAITTGQQGNTSRYSVTVNKIVNNKIDIETC